MTEDNQQFQQIFQDDDEDLFSEENLMVFMPSSQEEQFNVSGNVPSDPVCLRFDSFYLAVRYLSSQPFPINDLNNYAVVFPLSYWRSFPRSHKLDQVPCNIIKIQ